MSLQVNISGKEIAEAYEDVVNGNGNNWALFTYVGATNDLKVQATGDGGLEELVEGFFYGRVQYAITRVIEPHSQLPKLVQINWCGGGAPEAKKGLFNTHSKSVANFLRGTHVVINARNEGDVTAELIMKRVEAAPGAKYSVQKEAPRKVEPMASPRSSYTPASKVDMSALKRNVPPASKPAPPPSATSKPTPSAPSLYGRSTTRGSALANAWPEEKSVASAPQASPLPSAPPPAAPAPPVAQVAAMSTQDPGPRSAQSYGKGKVAVVLYDYKATEDNELDLTEGEHVEQVDEVDEGWWYGTKKDGQAGLFPSNYVEVVQAGGAEPPPPPPPPPLPDNGSTALALYDFDPAEDNEITFREGELITEIEPASEDWWQGKNSRGELGLFPANYVEVQK